MEDNKILWKNLHKENRYRPKYPETNVVQFIFRNIERHCGSRVLDLGCGAGRHVFFMANEGIVPYGVDFSDEGIQYTKEMLKENELSQFIDNIQVEDICNLKYEDNFFDGIICYGVLYYLKVEDIKKTVEEIYRTLKIGGKAMIVVRATDDYRYNTTYQSIEKNTFIINEENQERCANSENGMVMHFFTKEELTELFNGFSSISIDKITETHNNGSIQDSNYVVIVQK